MGLEEISLGRREGTCALQDYLVLLWRCHGEPNLRHSFVSSVLRAPAGGGCSPLGKNPNLFVDVCNIYCSGLEKIGKHWEEVAFRFSDTDEGFSEGLESLKPKDRARASQSPLVRIPFPMSLHCRGIPCPGFLNSSVSTQRCYLPNTLPVPLWLSPASHSRPRWLRLSCFKVNSGPTDPRAVG